MTVTVGPVAPVGRRAPRSPVSPFGPAAPGEPGWPFSFQVTSVSRLEQGPARPDFAGSIRRIVPTLFSEHAEIAPPPPP